MKTQATLQFYLQLGQDEMDRTTLVLNKQEIIDAYPCVIKSGDSFELRIPSGQFIGTVVLAEVASATEDNLPLHPGGQWIITTRGQWDGKQAGLMGGLCGRGHWSIITTGETNGTFGRAASLTDYAATAQQYRARFITDQDTVTGWHATLTEEGRKLCAEFLRAHGNPSVGFAKTDGDLDPNSVDWAAYTATLSFEDRLTQASATATADWPHFRRWLDQKYPVLQHCTSASAARARAALR